MAIQTSVKLEHIQNPTPEQVTEFYGEYYFTVFRDCIGENGQPNYDPQAAKELAALVVEICNPQSVLDCGCAFGALIHGFILLGLPVKLRGFDISRFAIDKAFPEVRELLTVADVSQAIPYEDSSFDLVLAIDLLEHIHGSDALKAAVRNICRVSSRYILLRQGMTTSGSSVEENHKWVETLNPLPHAARLALIDRHPQVKSCVPNPAEMVHPSEHPRDFWIALFDSVGAVETPLAERYYIFPNALYLHSFNTLFFSKKDAPSS